MEREIVMRTQGITKVYAMGKTEVHVLQSMDVEALPLLQELTTKNHHPANCTRNRCG